MPVSPGTVESEVAVRTAVVFGQLVVTELTAESQRVRADHAAEVVHDLIRGLGNTKRSAGCTEGKIVVKMDVRNVRVLAAAKAKFPECWHLLQTRVTSA